MESVKGNTKFKYKMITYLTFSFLDGLTYILDYIYIYSRFVANILYFSSSVLL